jgi:hypothetical protein
MRKLLKYPPHTPLERNLENAEGSQVGINTISRQIFLCRDNCLIVSLQVYPARRGRTAS